MRVYLAHRSRVVAVVEGRDNEQYIICYRGYALYFINARALHTLNIQLRYNLRITNTALNALIKRVGRSPSICSFV